MTVEKQLMACQTWSGGFIEYAYLSPHQQGRRNVVLRKTDAHAGWVPYQQLNANEKEKFRRQFSGGWEGGDKFTDPSVFKAKMTQGSDGIFRWKTNGRVPPKVIMALMALTEEEVIRHEEAHATELEEILSRCCYG